ncbi:hypothetical protein FE257_010698 [Aspergillus nanangensis]|uniref:Cytochrome P450 n=1 Tax=Aspergillus nanangensis TaxID=2582783 RepID=A0AAD4CIK3_ASPNN|nr:hypothetical protein FE257_010698 [Aspergillus nanangensis]
MEVFEAALTRIEGSPAAWVLILFVSVLGLRSYLTSGKKKEFPNVPWLKMSDLPGRAGELEDENSYVRNGHKVLQVGYDRYTKNGQNWMMRTPGGGQFVALPEHIEELRAAKDTDLHNLPANNDLMQTDYTMHAILATDQYHFSVVQKQLTHNLGPGLPYIVDECKEAFDDMIGKPRDWVSHHMYPLAFKITTRTANRLLFGDQLCKDDEFLQLAIDYSDTFFGGANLIRHYSNWMKPLVMYFKTGIHQQRATAMKHIGPLLKERIAAMDSARKNGTWQEFEKNKPSDVVQWVLDITPPEKMDLNLLVLRLLHILVSAVHTSSVTFLNSLYYLAIHPEVHDELRAEIVGMFGSENREWKKQGLTKLTKLDSFIKEVARFHPFTAGTMDRIAMKDYTLKDGTFIPKGTYILVPSSITNFDTDVWGPTAREFDPWRFYKQRQVPGQETLHSLVQTTPQFTYFGHVHGRHACPGRFFAANEIKVLMVYTLMNYDVKMPPDAPVPQMQWFSGKTMPDMQAHVMWKVRPNVQMPWKDVSEY